MRQRLWVAAVTAACAVTALLILTVQNRAPASAADEAAARQETSDWKTELMPTGDPLEVLMDSLTLEQKVGQIFLARCPETGAAEAVQQYHLGGFVLFDRDFEGETPSSMAQKIAGYQGVSDIPLLIAVDEEGGTVNRVSSHKAFRAYPFPSPRELYTKGGLELIHNTEAEKAQLLSGLGINVNLAPVCDITTNPSAFMYRRSLGQSPAVTGEFVTDSIQTMGRFGVAAVMKHFPGYGNNADTHTGIARDSRSLETLETEDMQPFFAGISAGGGAILVSHTIVEAIDPECPASLSQPMNYYLRLAMNFGGVIITDDLSMDAIAAQYGTEEAAVLAVLAGNDLLCSTEFETQYSAVLKACRSGRIPEAVLNEAVERVLRWKAQMGLGLPGFPAG
jgi:beta-N-acetylhexosaminidase